MKDANELYVASYEELIAEAINIWDVHAKRYANNLEKYFKLLEEKRKLGIRPLSSVNKTMLDNYPNIPFLKTRDIGEAMDFIADMNKKRLRRLIIETQRTLSYDYCFNTVSSWVSEAEYLISIHGRKTGFGVNPEAISGNRRAKRTSPKSNSDL